MFLSSDILEDGLETRKKANGPLNLFIEPQQELLSGFFVHTYAKVPRPEVHFLKVISHLVTLSTMGPKKISKDRQQVTSTQARVMIGLQDLLKPIGTFPFDHDLLEVVFEHLKVLFPDNNHTLLAVLSVRVFPLVSLCLGKAAEYSALE